METKIPFSVASGKASTIKLIKHAELPAAVTPYENGAAKSSLYAETEAWQQPAFQMLEL